MTSRVTLLLLLVGAPVGAQDFGPDTCASGYVWREAYPGDHVCVTPAIRSQAAADNRDAAQRRAPGGGPYGPDTCRQGFVWREARPEDHVCVAPETRAQAASDNQAAASRYARARRVLRPSDRIGDRIALPPGRIEAGRPQAPPPRSGSSVTRGFDENGEPYIEERLADGSLRREQRRGVTIIHPDGSKQFVPFGTIRSNAQPPTPPELPSDPARGRAWVSVHNEQLLDLIRALVNNDQAQMSTFTAAEARNAGSDLFRQIEYRTRVLEILAKP